jgi:Caspase domain
MNSLHATVAITLILWLLTLPSSAAALVLRFTNSGEEIQSDVDDGNVQAEAQIKLPEAKNADKTDAIFLIAFHLAEENPGTQTDVPGMKIGTAAAAGVKAGTVVTVETQLRLKKAKNRLLAVITEVSQTTGKINQEPSTTPTITVFLTKLKSVTRIMLVGISTYQAPRTPGALAWPNLCYPAADVLALQNYFLSLDVSHYTGDKELILSLKLKPDIRVLSTPKETQKDRILSEFAQIIERATHKDTVLVFFSGHGWYSRMPLAPFIIAPSDGEYVTDMPARMPSANLSFHALSDIYRPAIAARELGRLIFVIDTCQSAAAADPEDASRLFMLASTSPWSQALDSKTGCLPDSRSGKTDAGAFMTALLGGLSGDASVQKDNGVEIVSLTTLQQHVEDSLKPGQIAQSQQPMGRSLWFPIRRK